MIAEMLEISLTRKRARNNREMIDSNIPKTGIPEFDDEERSNLGALNFEA
jgi:hypothetical protein